MTTEVVTTPPSSTAVAVARTMRDNNVRFLPVTQPDGTVAGVVTGRGLVVRLVPKQLGGSMPIEELTTTEIIAW